MCLSALVPDFLFQCIDILVLEYAINDAGSLWSELLIRQFLPNTAIFFLETFHVILLNQYFMKCSLSHNFRVGWEDFLVILDLGKFLIIAKSDGGHFLIIFRSGGIFFFSAPREGEIPPQHNTRKARKKRMRKHMRKITFHPDLTSNNMRKMTDNSQQYEKVTFPTIWKN